MLQKMRAQDVSLSLSLSLVKQRPNYGQKSNCSNFIGLQNG